MKRTFLGGILLAVCLAVAYGYVESRRERNYRVLIERGEAALAKDDTFAAGEAFTSAIAIKGDSMLGYLKRGETYRRRDRLEAGIRALRHEVEPDPAPRPLLDAAMRDLQHAAELDPLAPRPLELLGDINYSLTRYDRAAARFRDYIRLDDRSPRVLYKLGLAEYSAGHFRAAVDVLQQAIRIDEHLAEAHYMLGLCFRELHKTEDARRALERSVALAPALLYARQELANLYRRIGRPADRLAQLEALLAIEPGPSRHVALGTAYADAGRFDRAINTLGSAAELYPDHAYTYVALGRVWLDKLQPQADRVDLAKALGALQGAIGGDPSGEALMLFGRALLLSDDTERAESVLQQATSTFPADPLAFYYLAEAAERQDHHAVARRALLDYRALEGDPADGRRRAAMATRIADLSAKEGDAAAAVTWYQRAIDANGADAALLIHLAGAQIESGALDAARATLLNALELDPENRAATALQRRLK